MKSCSTVAVILAAILLPAIPIRSIASEFPFDPVGARHVGMGAASAAVWNGPDAVYHNPASLVWQHLTFSAGFQPVQLVDWPASWWLHFYNKETDWGMPAALIAQGWNYPSPSGTGHYYDFGFPLALNLTDATPGATTVHFAWERRPDGTTRFQIPFDLGFLARHPSGATLGIVARGLTFGENKFENIGERIEYGASYGAAGRMTFSSSVLWLKGDDWATSLKRYRFGGEIGGEGRLHLLGGYIHEPDHWFATGGISLRSDATGRYEVVYSVVYDREHEHFSHFVQYGVRMF